MSNSTCPSVTTAAPHGFQIQSSSKRKKQNHSHPLTQPQMQEVDEMARKPSVRSLDSLDLALESALLLFASIPAIGLTIFFGCELVHRLQSLI